MGEPCNALTSLACSSIFGYWNPAFYNAFCSANQRILAMQSIIYA